MAPGLEVLSEEAYEGGAKATERALFRGGKRHEFHPESDQYP
jgi:hypothetical protein